MGMLDLNPRVLYPEKSHRKIIKIPSRSKELAELMGIIAGDGGINNPWQLVITMNSDADAKYAVYVQELLQNLFDIPVAVRKRPKINALVLVSSGRNLVDFLVAQGAIRGNKVKQQVDISGWITENSEYKQMFVRGLIDTDGCLYIHKHGRKGGQRIYNNLGLCFTNRSPKLIEAVAVILQENKIVPHIQGQNLYLYSVDAVQKYLGIFGSSNPRITNKYKQWLQIRRDG
ncbi:MAG TPA: LAGLIDADG family homing endonuclease [Candidatus Paceibacterota bacterium]|nr:LAGLIDADG family homing endonuclease [Candidatus Paceibacterota bacterium]